MPENVGHGSNSIYMYSTSIVAFWVAAPCFVGGYKGFGGTLIITCNVTTQETTIDIFTVMRTSDTFAHVRLHPALLNRSVPVYLGYLIVGLFVAYEDFRYELFSCYLCELSSLYLFYPFLCCKLVL